jgi:hypothetical protein
LTLLADGFAKDIDLDVACLLGELAARDLIVLEHVQGAQERGGEAAGRTQAGSGRDVGHAGDFQVVILDADQLHGLADDGVRVMIIFEVREAR